MSGRNVADIRLEINNQCHLLEKGKYYLIGKDSLTGNSPNYIQLTDWGLDEKHCLLWVYNEEVIVVDLESTTGIYVNNKRVEPLTGERIKPDGELGLGGELKAKIKLVGKEESQSSGPSSPILKNTSNAKELISQPITGKKSLNVNSNNDSSPEQVQSVENNVVPENDDIFMVPETQFYPSKLRASTTNVGNNDNSISNQISFNGDESEEENFFIPETQEVVAKHEDFDDESFTEKRSSMANFTDMDETKGSQFKICTQEFNDESTVECSQIIPIIKHNAVLLSESGRILKQSQGTKEQTKETSELNCPSQVSAQYHESLGTAFRDETATPDIFDLLEEENQITNDNTTNNAVEDEEDLIPTQVVPTRAAFKNKPQNEISRIGNIELNENLSTLREKENTHPANEARSKSICMIASVRDMENNADNVLTDEFIKPPILKPIATKISSTLLTDKQNQKSSPKRFKELEPKLSRHSDSGTFKSPPSNCSPGTSNTSVTSSLVDLDLELLMCTPQVIKEYINISGVRLLTAKNVDVNRESEEKEENVMVKLINKKSKENKDFEALLPHIKSPLQSLHKRSQKSHNVRKVKVLCHDFIRNDIKNKGKVKIEQSNKKLIVDNEKKSQNSKSSKHLEKSHTSKSTTQNSAIKSTASVRSNVMQEEPNRRLTRARTRDRELQSASSGLGKVDSKSDASVSDSTTELPSKRLTRSRTQDELHKSATNSTSNVHEKKRNDSLYLHLENADELDLIPTQPLKRTVENRRLSKQNYGPSNRNSSEQKGLKNELKRKCFDISSSKESSKRPRKTNGDESNILSTSSKRCLQVSTTMVDNDVFEKLIRNSKDLWAVADDPLNSELLIMDQGSRTYKFLLALAKGIPIVTTEWIKKVNENRSLIPFKNDFFSDPTFEERHKFSILKSLGMARKKGVFQGYGFFVTSNIRPQPREIKNIIECAGGQVHNELKKFNKEKQGKIYLISCSIDKKDWHTFQRHYKNITIVSTEAVMSSIMRQDVKQLDKFILKI
uniref:Mediator of DNA damage checkpoint protein 1 n=1 Tax=Glossina brevipalpis TaxID=37001 RepID=A0A1A9WWE8_9MUSC